MAALIITIILGIAGIICTFLLTRWQVKRNRIDHFFINSYDIGVRLTDDFPNYKLHYGDVSIENNVKVLKGGFMNTGRKDIDGLKGEADIILSLPTKCVVKDIKVFPSNDNLNIKACINNNGDKDTIEFGIKDIFISDEHFEYTAIVEVPEDMVDLEEEITFHHRIKDTEKIKNIHVGPVQNSVKNNKLKKGTFLVCAGFLVLALIFSFCQKVQFKIFHNETRKEVSVMISPKSNIYINNTHIFYPIIRGEKITKEEFLKDYSIIPVTTYGWTQPIFSFAMFLLLIFFMGIIYCEEFHGRKAQIIKVIIKDKQQLFH